MLPQARMLKVDFSFRQQEKKQYFLAGRYVSEYQPGPDGFLLPAHFQEYFYDTTTVDNLFPPSTHTTKEPEAVTVHVIKGIAFESEAIYVDYRRFSAEVKIVPEEPPAEP